ncbi:MAG: hypothetical protein L6R37_007599 [Teloschistes peruensis]|nr:MAG: hypothetical protein L6R37_007599 [Teloschistes peruensis]
MATTTFSNVPIPEQQAQRTSQLKNIPMNGKPSLPVNWTPELIENVEEKLRECQEMFDRRDRNLRPKPDDTLKFSRRGTPKDTFKHIAKLRAEARQPRVRRKQPLAPPDHQPERPVWWKRLWKKEPTEGFKERILKDLTRQGRRFLPEIHRGTEFPQPENDDLVDEDDTSVEDDFEEDEMEIGSSDDLKEDKMDFVPSDDRREDEMEIVPSDDPKEDKMEIVPSDDPKEDQMEFIPSNNSLVPLRDLAQVCAMEFNAIC